MDEAPRRRGHNAGWSHAPGRMSSPHLRRLSLLDLFTVAALLCLCVAAAVLLLQVQAQANATASVTHTREVLERVASARLAIVEAESSERGFLLSGDPRHVQRYEASRAQSQQQLQQLAALTRENPRQQAVLAHLASETERHLDVLRANIDHRRTAGPVDPAAFADAEPEMARVDGYAVQLQQQAGQLLEERRATAMAARRGVAVSAAGIVLLAMVLVLLLRSAARRERDQASPASPGHDAGPGTPQVR